jgi:hypothetical protein
VVSLFGLGFGMWFARVANVSPARIWVAYVALTVLHLVSNYIAMRCVSSPRSDRTRSRFRCRAQPGMKWLSVPCFLEGDGAQGKCLYILLQGADAAVAEPLPAGRADAGVPGGGAGGGVEAPHGADARGQEGENLRVGHRAGEAAIDQGRRGGRGLGGRA